jgi:hypothetical protein
MIKVLNSLFRLKSNNSASNSLEEEQLEKKKCKKCLRRVELSFLRCPYCRGSEFHDA